MARPVVTSLALLFCYIFLSSSALELPPDGFWFNCGLDFCEFPAEYCRVIKGQRPSCHTCTQDVCYSLDKPSQCYSRCKELENGGSGGIGGDQAAKEGLLGVEEEEKYTSLDRLLEGNERHWIVIFVLVTIIIVMLVFLTILLITIRRGNRKLNKLIKDTQRRMSQPKAEPQQMINPNDEETGFRCRKTVEKGVHQNTRRKDNRPFEEVPLLPSHENKQPAQAAGEQCQPIEQSGNIECQFSCKLMDDGSSGLSRHTEESTNWPSNQAVTPVISHPIDDHRSSNLADCNLLDKHNMEQTLNANELGTSRHSLSTDETMTKNIIEKEDQVSLPKDIEKQVQYRPRSTIEENNVTPTAPLAESSVSLPSEGSGATSGISTPDSGHYGTGNSSPTGSFDLKNNIMQQSAVNSLQQDVKS